jgi:hypothetical protein
MWGRFLADQDGEPRTIEEAQLTVLMAIADQNTKLLAAFQDIQNRLYRIESWLEDYGPGYTQTAAYSHSTAQGDDRADAAALPAGYASTRR